jgi:hypothetical protein
VILEEAAEAGPHSDDGSGSSSSSSRSTHVSPCADATAAPTEADGAAPGQQQQPQPLDAGLQPPAAPCSRPQSHQTSRRCSTAQGSRPGTAGALNSARLGQLQQQTRISDSSNVTPVPGVRQGSPSAAAVDGAAGEQLRPGSAAAAAGSGPSRPGNASPPSRGRPGSAVTTSAGLASRGRPGVLESVGFR